MISPPVIFPGGFGIRRITDKEVTDFPDPDSPTIPTVSPRERVNEILLTAFMVSSSVRNSVTRFFISSNRSLAIFSNGIFRSAKSKEISSKFKSENRKAEVGFRKRKAAKNESIWKGQNRGRKKKSRISGLCVLSVFVVKPTLYQDRSKRRFSPALHLP